MKNLLAACIRNTVLANILLVLILSAAALATRYMVRESWPEFRLDMALVTVAYPGADPEEVEEAICRKMEDALSGVEGIKEIRTTASEGVGMAVLELYERADAQKTLNAIRNRIDSISTFPEEAEKPVIEDFETQEPVLMLAAGGDLDPVRLKEWANDLKDDLRRLPDIRRVSVIGDLPYEISIEVSEERLRELNLTFGEVAQAVRANNLNHPCGLLRTLGQEFRLRMLERKYTAEDIGRIVVRAYPDGRIVTLDRIADVKDVFEDVPLVCEVNGKPGVYLAIGKTPDQDALRVADAVQDWLKELNGRLPVGAGVHVVYDLTEELRQRIGLLVRNGLSGLLLVLVLLGLFLDTRVSFWVSIGMVTGLGAGLTFLWMLGGTLNMVSLFALIMVLGILVDDGIVVGEAIHERRVRGESGLHAAVNAVGEMGMPVVAAVTTTIVAFIPLLFIGGIMGKFIRILPTVVIACLTASLLECLFILPAHLAHGRISAPDPRTLPRWRRWAALLPAYTRAALPRFVDRFYLPTLRRILDKSYVSLCALLTLVLLVGGLLVGGFVQFVLFPESDGFVLTATVEFPDGTPLNVTEAAVRHIEKSLELVTSAPVTRHGKPIVKSHQTLVGFSFGETVSGSGSHVGSVQAVLVDSSERSIHSKPLMADWERAIGHIAGANVLRIEGLEMGPPGSDLEIEIKGRRMDELAAASSRLQEKLRSCKGVLQIRSDSAPGKEEIRFHLKPEAYALGFHSTDLASHLADGFFGAEPLTLQRGRDEVKVKVRYPDANRNSLAELEHILVRGASGAVAPLSSVADIEFAQGVSTIQRIDGLRRIVVSAEVDATQANAEELTASLSQTVFPELVREFPGISLGFSGEKKKSSESFESLKVGFPLAVLGIYIIIAAMFRSYVQPFVILFTVPFGLIGAVLGHLLMGLPLSMMSLFGMVALAGVVVNDAIVLIEAFNGNLALHMPFLDALLEACRSRFRAIFLTTVTTVGGLAPLILERSYQAQSMIPMALSIAAGLVFSTLLTLFILPSLLVILNDLRLGLHVLLHHATPARETVEPATRRKEEF